MRQSSYKQGDWNAICDICGIKFKSSMLKQRWDGFMVCSEDWETRHVSDFIKGSKPIPALPFTRPEAADLSCAPTYISTSTGSQDTTIPTVTSGNGSTI